MTSTETIVANCFFATKPCQKLHVHYLMTEPRAYLSALETLSIKGILSTVSQATKARILVALHVCKQHKSFIDFFYKCEAVELLKACETLDRPRLMRQLQDKIRLIESQNPHLREETASRDEDDAMDNKEEDYDNEVGTKEKRCNKRQKKSSIHSLRRQLKTLKALDEENHTCETCAVAHTNTAVKEVLDSASLSGALALKIRKWAQRFESDFLEFIVMTGATEIWKKLADYAHFATSDFSLSYFLSVVHGADIPEGTFVRGMRRLMEAPRGELAELFAKLALDHPQVYKSFTFLRTCPRLLADRSIAENLAQHIPLGTAIWYLEELCQASRAAVANILTKRLQSEPNWMEEDDSKVAASFAKLVERIKLAHRISPALANALVPAAERRMGALKEITEMPGETLIIGDASASMQTAIDSATIFAAMISVCWGGMLCFFSRDFIASPHPRPATVKQVLEITNKIRANSCTAVAAGLWFAYNQRTIFQRIVLVTDEEENTPFRGFMFAQLLRAYMNEVNPAVELLLVGVGSGDCHFQESLRRLDIDFKRVEIDERRPDLTKFDALLQQMSLLSGPSEVPPTAAEHVAVESEEDEFVVVEDEEMR